MIARRKQPNFSHVILCQVTYPYVFVRCCESLAIITTAKILRVGFLSISIGRLLLIKRLDLQHQNNEQYGKTKHWLSNLQKQANQGKQVLPVVSMGSPLIPCNDKCDEQKPICHRCRKAKRVCYGYPDQSDLVFRDQNRLAKRYALENKAGLTPRFHQDRGLLIRSFSVDPDDAVLNQFFCFSNQAGGNKEGPQSLPALMPSLYASARSNSPCAPAILAMAWLTSAPFATLGQRMGAARRNYGQAVVKLQNALQDPRTAKADDALFTVLLMLMIEVFRPLICFIWFWCLGNLLLTSGYRT